MEECLNDYYFDRLDLSVLEDFVRTHGVLREFGKHDYFARQGMCCPKVGYVEEGMFRFLRTDAAGNEHVVGYSLAHSLVAEYSSCLCSRPGFGRHSGRSEKPGACGFLRGCKSLLGFVARKPAYGAFGG